MHDSTETIRISSALEFLPDSEDLEVMKSASEHGRGCDLYQNATQTVPGEGKANSSLFLVGEQPGDKEDLEGHPFAGPAGRLLNECMHAPGIYRDSAYVTNAVMHFKWEPRGKIRLHAAAWTDRRNSELSANSCKSASIFDTSGPR